jgi:hypothetical protein
MVGSVFGSDSESWNETAAVFCVECNSVGLVEGLSIDTEGDTLGEG